MTQPSEAVALIPHGSVTSAEGFRAGAVAAGIKASGRHDLGLLVSDQSCIAAAMFTQNAFPAAPVLLSRERVGSGRAQAIVFNSGNANACNGDAGLTDAIEMARLAGETLGISPDLVLVASTGVIGHRLPMDCIREGLPRVEPRPEGGHEAALGIMTTDSRPKEVAVSTEIDGCEVHVGGMAKGVGMIHPNMATMLVFLATDAALDEAYAGLALRRVAERTFNMITVDGDTSTNDSCFLLANGMAGNKPVTVGSANSARFIHALDVVCTELARMLARDGEGATKLIQVDVTGARSVEDARDAARAVVRSNLVKAAVHGEDPNWGRIFMAVGNSGARFDPQNVSLWIGSLQIARDGVGLGVPKEDGHAQMTGDEVHIRVDLGAGSGTARAWGCDLTEQYVIENSAYTT